MYRLQPHNWAEARTFYGDDDGGGNPPPKLTAAELLARYGASPERLAENLEKAYGENFSLREKNRGLTGEVTTLKANQRPDGAVILTGDDAKAYEAYTALGKPDELATIKTERDTLATEVATTKKQSLLRDVAEIAEFKPAVLTRLGGDLDYVIKEVTEGEVTRKAAYVKTEQGEKPLTEYAQAQWGDFLPALTATGGTEQQGQRTQGVPFPAMQGSGGQKPQSESQVAQGYMANKYKGPPKRG